MEIQGAGASIVVFKNIRSVMSNSTNQRIILASITIGVALVGILSHYLRRTHSKKELKKEIDCNKLKQEAALLSVENSKEFRMSPSGRGNRSSIASSRITDITLVSNSVYENQTAVPGLIGPGLTSTQLGILGLESVEKSIQFWESAMRLLESNTEYLPQDEQLRLNSENTKELLEKILDTAYTLQKLSEELFLHENSVLYAESEKSYRLRSVSSVESFMSAEDFLSDDEDITNSLQLVGFESNSSIGSGVIYPLYEAALRLVEGGTVPYRSLKTELVGCKYGDQEYLAKLHCLRGAFSRILSDSTNKNWIAQCGKEVLTKMLRKADKDPKDFIESYDKFILWSQEAGNWALTESELKDRGLRALTFYDIVLDFIFMDAFEDLEAPPASVLAVTQNRWLSNSFKETALSTAVWSVLKTKRRWLRYPDGFVAHFYDVSEHMMPTLAWGYLGPPSHLQDLCIYFKDKFTAFLRAIFSFDKVRYTTLDNLASDVLTKMEEMYHLVIERLEESSELHLK